jgi:hypothetical protein
MLPTRMRRRVPDLSILAPSRSDAEPYFSDVQAKPCEYLAWLNQIKRHRRHVYLEAGYLRQESGLCEYDDFDSKSWHLFIAGQGNSDLLACVRMTYFCPAKGFPSSEDVLAFAGVQFPTRALYAAYLSAIEAHLVQIQCQRKRFFYVGGLAVNRKARRLGYGAILGMAANALARIMDHAEGLSFAQRSKEGSGLFQKLGGYPIKEELPSFRCCRFGTELSLIALRPNAPLLRRDDLVEGIKHHLVTQRVTVRH